MFTSPSPTAHVDHSSILNLDFDTAPLPNTQVQPPFVQPPAIRDIGCQSTQESSQPVVIKEAKKLSLPHFAPSKLSWSSFAMKLHAALIECDLAYLLRENCTNTFNAIHSKELMLELFKKLQGSAIALFTGMPAQRYYLEGGRGIEMVKALVNKFHPMDNRAIQNIISSMQSLSLGDLEDLSVYRDKLENFNLQLSWVSQEMSPLFLVYLAQSQLGKSRYKADIEALQMSHTASGTSFTSLDDLCNGLKRLDKLRGLPYGGAAPVSTPKTGPSNLTSQKRNINAAFVAAVTPGEAQVGNLTSSELEMHKDAWVGAINLPEEKAKLLRQMLKCIVCRSNAHTLPYCPTLKNWSIKKKPRQEGGKDSDTPTRDDPVLREVGGANSVLAPSSLDVVAPPPPASTSLPIITENPVETDDADESPGNVEFDLLEDFNSLAIMTISGNVYPYSAPNASIGSVHSVLSSQDIPCHSNSSTPTLFQLIVDSGCTKHMFPYRDLFISFKDTPTSFVTLADKSRVPCIGIGAVQFSLLGKNIILEDVLCVPNLCCPLLSVQCFRRLQGCSFLADNTGSYLTFRTFILPVNDSSDCIIMGSSTHTSDIAFDSRLSASVQAVSDNTQFRNKRRPIVTNKPPSTTDTSSEVTTSAPNEASPTNTAPVTPDQLFQELGLPPTPDNTSSLSPSQIQAITTAIIKHLQQHGRITPSLINFIKDGYTNPRNATSTTPQGRPILLSCDKMSNTAPQNIRFTVQQLSRYFGFRSFKSWDNLYETCQSNFSFIKPSDTPLELGQVANIKKARRNTTPIDRPSNLLEVVHCYIGYGDTKAVGNGASHCLVLVDRTTRYTWIYPLKSLHHEALKAAISAWSVDAGGFPQRLYTDFDPKIIEGPTAAFLRDNKVSVRAAPSGRQNQNGLVERTWETIINMGRAYIMDMQMPRSYWYWALRQAVQALNYVPCTVEGVPTSPHELMYGVKPDLRVLFRMFSTPTFLRWYTYSLRYL